MKKIYQNPEIMVVKVQTVHMIAASDQQLIISDTHYNGSSVIESRRGRYSVWDDEE